MTLLGYFNSLRELGGARRIVEDEVNVQLRAYSRRKRDAEALSLFGDREIGYEVLELTSRVSTDKVAEARRRLGLSFEQKERVDVAIATNMISVGLDIKRLGLMVVFGQPKASAEYIQATSRVGRDVEGRDSDRPGLVVTVLNINRPRDRSHYERFVAYHQTFYRSVEATSVTPFSPRALDRGLAGTAVALARQRHTPLTPPKGATEIVKERSKLDFVVNALAERAASHMMLSAEDAKAVRERVRLRVADLLDEWEKLANEQRQVGGYLQYQEHEAGNARPLLHQFLDAELKTLSPKYRLFRANRSMRNVEPGVGVWVKNLDNIDLGGGS
jgi:superfamily II DNA/RNA helicase